MSALPPSAFLLDFNGTLSDDEGLLFELYAGLAAEAGRPLDEGSYRSRLAGLTDEGILGGWLGDRSDIPDLVTERIRRYIARAGDGHTIRQDVAAAVWSLAAAGPVAIVSSAFREEIVAVLAGAGLAKAVTTIVAREDVLSPKPSPEPYLTGLARLGAEPADAVAFEDTPTGLAAASAAGVPCVAIRGTVPDHLLRPRLTLADGLDRALVRRLLGPRPARPPAPGVRRFSAATGEAEDFTAV